MRHSGAVVSIIMVMIIAGVWGCAKTKTTEQAQPAEPPPAKKIVLEIFAPCAFADATSKIIPLFEAEHPGVRVSRTVENVGTLVPRIINGAKPDVFLCIGDHEVETLDKKGLVEFRKTFCFTSLVLVVPQANPARVRKLEDLAKPEVKTIAIASDERSAGYYAHKILEEQGLWDKLQPKLVRPRFPVELLKLASQGRVQASIAYAACFRAEEGEKKQLAAQIKLVQDFQDDYCQTIACDAAVIKGAEHADLGREFIEFLSKPECQQILKKAGFLTLDEPKCFPTGKKKEMTSEKEATD